MELNVFHPDVFAFWVATAIYALSTVFLIMGFLSKREKFASFGMILVWIGFFAQTFCISWPAITNQYTHICSFYKVLGSLVWMGMFVFLCVSLVKKEIIPAGLLILPISFVLMMLGGLIPGHPLGASPMYKGWKLWSHITAGGFNFGFALLAGGTGFLYLIKEKVKGKTGYPYDQLPDLEVLDRLNYRFVQTAFILATIMVSMGSLYAYLKFGIVRKTIVLGALVWGFWSIYAIVLGLRRFAHWRGRKPAIYSLIALLLVMIFMFYAAPFRENSYHSGPFYVPYDLEKQKALRLP